MEETTQETRVLAQQIRASRGRTEAVRTTLQTDGRVLARITEGIYRQPASALRELISNAYDADATRVAISTDRPRFARIVVEDDGHGMSPDALAHVLRHIGGSAKRSVQGADLGVTRTDDAFLSPKGRRLIGKIGIGLFSVAQLTHSFQIITKVRGDAWRTVATVNLRQYSDQEHFPDDEYEPGDVAIWQEPAHDVDAHGTTIVLHDIRPKTKETLQSVGHWLRVDQRKTKPPIFHIGEKSRWNDGTLEHLANIPWEPGDEPEEAFRKLVEAVWQQVKSGENNPKLEILFDYYLQMVWQLGLAAPLRYAEGDPLDIPFTSAYVYELPGTGPDRARELDLDGGTIREVLGWPHWAGDGDDSFRVYLDNLELRRPLKFTDLPVTSHAVKKPIIFFGHLREEFTGVDYDISGGPLEFRAYLMWTPKIAPVEHAGVLVRVHGASGTLFDPTFLKFQVAEITRLRQITCEIFVSEGFEAALNIDREAFNFAHPHVVRLTSWLHTAVTRAINQQKRISSDLRKRARQEAGDAESAQLSEISSSAWRVRTGDDYSKPKVALVGRTQQPSETSEFAFSREELLGELAEGRSQQSRSVERKIEAIAQVLIAFGAFDELGQDEQQELLRHIGEILRVQP
jgi:hypothetical protein